MHLQIGSRFHHCSCCFPFVCARASPQLAQGWELSLVLAYHSLVWLDGNKVVLSQIHAARSGSRISGGLTLYNANHAIIQVGKLLWTSPVRNSALTT